MFKNKSDETAVRKAVFDTLSSHLRNKFQLNDEDRENVTDDIVSEIKNVMSAISLNEESKAIKENKEMRKQINELQSRLDEQTYITKETEDKLDVANGEIIRLSEVIKEYEPKHSTEEFAKYMATAYKEWKK